LQSKPEDEAQLARIQKEIDESPEAQALLEDIRKHTVKVRELLDNPTTRAAKRFEAGLKKSAEVIARGRTLLRRLKVCESLNPDDDRDFWPAFYRALRHLGLPEGAINSLPPEAFFPLLESWLRLAERVNPGAKLSASARKRLKVSGGRPEGTKVDGPKLRELRKSIVKSGGKATTQATLAEICGVSPDTIQRGERGGVWSDDIFAKVATGLTQLGQTVQSEDLKKHS
jgi:hypothetical protein